MSSVIGKGSDHRLQSDKECQPVNGGLWPNRLTSVYPSLQTSVDYGIYTGMGEMRKVTVEVSADDLAAAQDFTGAGVSETMRTALKQLRSMRAQQELLKLRGTFKFSLGLDELREDRE